MDNTEIKALVEQSTPNEFKTLLAFFGNDKKARAVIDAVIEGYVQELLETGETAPAVAEKIGIFSRFNAGALDQSPVISKLAAAYNQTATRVQNLEFDKKDLQQQVTYERAKNSNRDYPGIH